MTSAWQPRTRCYLDGAARRPLVAPDEFLKTCLAVIEERDRCLHAFVDLFPEDARAAADASARRWREGKPLSPIDGMPIAIKDIIDVAGAPTRMNSPIFEKAPPARVDAACVAALRAAGAVVIGKTATTEFACGRSAATVNPFDPQRTPGGSSSGSGAAVGIGMVPAALGTQTRASVIRPAAFCGAYGFKPSFGTLHLGGVHPVAGSFDHLGVLAASLDECWTVARAIAQEAGGLPGHHALTGPAWLPEPVAPAAIAVIETEALAQEDDASRALFAEMVEHLRGLGYRVITRRDDERVEAVERALQGCDFLAREMVGYEARWPFARYRAHDEAALGQQIKDALALGERLGETGYREQTQRRAAIAATVEALRDEVEVIVTLAAGLPPVGLQETGSRLFITPWTTIGAPSLTLPLLALDEMPVGLQLVGWRNHDAGLVAHAAALERAFREPA